MPKLVNYIDFADLQQASILLHTFFSSASFDETVKPTKSNPEISTFSLKVESTNSSFSLPSNLKNSIQSDISIDHYYFS